MRKARSPAIAWLLAAAVSMAAACSAAAPPAQLVQARIPVGDSPGAPVVANGYVWVPEPNLGRLVQIDPRRAHVVRTLQIGDREVLLRQGCAPYSVHQGTPGNFVLRMCDLPTAVEPGDGVVWVARNDTESVEALDPASGRVVTSVAVHHPVWDLAAGAGRLWVTSYFDNLLLEIDPASGASSEIGGLPNGSSGVLYAYGSVWVASSRHGVVARLDPSSGREVAEISMGYERARPLPLLAADGSVWCRLESGDAVARIDPRSNTVTTTIPVAIQEGRDGIDRLGFDGATVWVSGLSVDGVSVKTNNVVRRLPLTGTAVDYGYGRLWATDIGGPLYSVIP